MEELTLAQLCAEVREGEIEWSRHYGLQLFERDQPSRADIQFMLCEDDPSIRERYTQSCLIWGFVEAGRRGHVICTYPPGAKVVTAYWPDTDPDEWENDYRDAKRERDVH